MFKNIRLPDHCEPVFLEWIDPVKNETLKNYALRLAEGINTNEPFAIIGLSMGGMITSEIARTIQTGFYHFNIQHSLFKRIAFLF